MDEKKQGRRPAGGQDGGSREDTLAASAVPGASRWQRPREAHPGSVCQEAYEGQTFISHGSGGSLRRTCLWIQGLQRREFHPSLSQTLWNGQPAWVFRCQEPLSRGAPGGAALNQPVSVCRPTRRGRNRVVGGGLCLGTGSVGASSRSAVRTEVWSSPPCLVTP